MDNLDAPTPTPAAPIWNTVLNYGLYTGGALVAFSLLMYLLDVNLMTISGLIMLYGSIFLVGFTFAALAIRHQRDKLDGGYISYGKALLVGLLTVFIGLIISSVWNYVMVNFIDPGAIATMKEQFVESWGESMPPEALEQALEGFDKADNLGTILMNGLTGGGFFGLIIGLITAAFMKRQPEISMR